VIVRLLLVLLLAGLSFGQSHPSWWTYASPEATALAGIQWDRLESSHSSGAIAGELWGAGSLGFPDLDCVTHARQILISSPALLGTVVGSFSAATVQSQAAAKGLTRARYHGVDLFIAPDKDTLSLARINDQLVLVGQVRTLQETIDRSVDPTKRAYSPLLARAAKFAAQDLWVVATHLPDSLGSRFVPKDIVADVFEGPVPVGKKESEPTIREAEVVKPQVAKPQVAKIEVRTQAADVKKTEVPPAPITPVLPVAKPEPPKPVEPQIIRIFGLDDGPREIVMPRD